VPKNVTTRPPAHPSPPPVAVLRWPEQDAERYRLAALGLPRVLLTAMDVVPPTLLDDRELWLRDGSNMATAADAVERLRREAELAASRPLLDEDGWLRHDGRWVWVPRREYGVLALLVRHHGRIVPRPEVLAAYSAGRPEVSRAAVGAFAKRIDARVATVGLRVHILRHRGFMLARMPADQELRAGGFT
jgi:hypothetical protein